MEQVLFALALLLSLAFFAWTARRIFLNFTFTRPDYPVKDHGRRLRLMLRVAFGQSKIFRQPFTGLLHALVFWGFCVILFGTVEMIIDGLTGIERCLSVLGPSYSVITASGDLFALVVSLAIVVFLIRRFCKQVKRFRGIEMRHKSHLDANIALTLILLLMITLSGMNTAGISLEETRGSYPVSQWFAVIFSQTDPSVIRSWYQVFWWSHILLIFLFANILPYSKHFHVFMAVPNVYLSRLEPLGKLSNMDSITREVKLMMQPGQAAVGPGAGEESPARFGVKDVEDIDWKSYFDSLACTECGRCTSVCPASMTGKRLSPRKIIMDVRARMKEKAPGMIRHGKDYRDPRSLLRDYVSEEELWACTTCNACAQECPVNINHPLLIIAMRRYLVLEEGSAPGELKAMFSYIENNGAPWQFSAEDRVNWTRDLSYQPPAL